MIKVHNIHGGVHPPENKRQSLLNPLATMPIPAQLVLPLNMHIGTPAEPIVAVGDRVLTGQMIAKPCGPFSAAIHASSSGTVIAIENRPLAHVSGLDGLSIVIATDGLDQWIEKESLPHYAELNPAELIERLRAFGIAGMGGAGFPTAVKLKPRHKINTLILNGTECEPYITADHELMRSFPEQVIAGAQLLAFLLNDPTEILIGIEDNKPDAYEKLLQAAKGTKIQVVEFPTKYPSGGEKQLIEILTGRQVPSGGLPADLGIVVQNVGTAVASWKAIVQGEPLISRLTTFVGKALQHSGNFEVRLGTPIEFGLQHCGFDSSECERVIMGGPMMGFTLPNLTAPVIKVTNCILTPTRTELPLPPPAQPCIRCGQCAEACPVELLPQQLFWYSLTKDTDKLQDHNLFDCIECGACSYVCPSHIPLVQYYRASKSDIREQQREKLKSDQARVRFESRKLRLEQEAMEREAKRLERMETKKKENLESSGSDSSIEDLVKTAQRRVAQNPVDPQEEKNRLERQIHTLKERIDSLQIALASTFADEQRAKTEAQLLNTQTKLEALITKLKSLETAVQPPQDAAALAIARAMEKSAVIAQMSQTEKLQATLDSLEKRIATTRAKVAEAETTESDTLDTLKSALAKLEEKRLETERLLAAENAQENR